MVIAEGELRHVPVADIQVPDARVSAQYDSDLEEELDESIARQGVLVPLSVVDIEGTLWLVDGLHRLQSARRHNLQTVPALVRPATTEDLLLRNLTTSRAKGKSNPAEEARLIRQLREDGGVPLERIAEMTGISVRRVRSLHDLAHLPDEVLAMLAAGKLGVTHALELLPLPTPELQREVATQAVEWKYTVEQVHYRVGELVRPVAAPAPGATTFDERGAPHRIPIPCFVCRRDLTGNVSYIYLCGEDQELIAALVIEYLRAEASAAAPSAAPVAASAPRPPNDGAPPP